VLAHGGTGPLRSRRQDLELRNPTDAERWEWARRSASVRSPLQSPQWHAEWARGTAAWAAARTLADAGELTAQWWEHPAGDYYHPADPFMAGQGEDRPRSRIAAIAGACRAGFHIPPAGAREGFTGVFGGCQMSGRAMVEGFATPAASSHLHQLVRGVDAQRDGRIAIMASFAPRTSDRRGNIGREMIGPDMKKIVCGGAVSRRTVARGMFPGCPRALVRLLQDAEQVTVVDLEWGRVDSPLWGLLAAFENPGHRALR
jgi:hypothetical protein